MFLSYPGNDTFEKRTDPTNTLLLVHQIIFFILEEFQFQKVLNSLNAKIVVI